MLVQASWVLIRKDGAPRKWYAIASTGKEALAEYAEDIRQRQENLSYFIARYRKVADPGDLDCSDKKLILERSLSCKKHEEFSIRN